MLPAAALLWCVSTPARAGSPAVVSFYDTATVNDSVIRLGDIAAIAAASEARRRATAAIVVGRSAPPGFARYVCAQDVNHFVLAPSGDSRGVVMEGAARTHVHTAARTVSLSDYDTRIRDYIASRVAWAAGDYAVEPLDARWRVFDKPFTVHFDGLTQRYPRGATRFDAVTVQGGDTVRTPVQVRIEVVARVAVAAEPIRRGQAIGPEHLAFERRTITSLRRVPVTSAGQCAGMRAKRSISAGATLHHHLLARPPAVVKGDMLYLSVRNGACAVSVPVRARENGAIGERIWVENSVSHTLIRVRVTAKNAVSLPSEEAI
jgi:flagella basal body P-ring formation protein FlgA